MSLSQSKQKIKRELRCIGRRGGKSALKAKFTKLGGLSAEFSTSLAVLRMGIKGAFINTIDQS